MQGAGTMGTLALRRFGWPIAALICLALSGTRSEAGPLQDCAAMLPWGVPAVANDAAPHTYLCRLAYVVRHNDLRHEPDWVAWPTSRANAAGCLPRSDSFRADQRDRTPRRHADPSSGGHRARHQRAGLAGGPRSLDRRASSRLQSCKIEDDFGRRAAGSRSLAGQPSKIGADLSLNRNVKN